MPELDDAQLEYLLRRAGLSASAEQKAGLKAAYLHLARMAESVRKPRGRMAEPALTYGFGGDDLR